MIIKIAEHAGFCFGVKMAFESGKKALNLGDLYLKGDLVHNKSVMKHLTDLGLKGYDDELPENKKVLLRSHGELKEVKKDLKSKGNEVLDCTCPVLLKMYRDLDEMYKKGYKVIIVGDKDHPEIMALNSHINYDAIVVNSVDEAKEIENLENLYIISQTTNIYGKFSEISDIILRRNRNVVVKNTICNATRMRQMACRQLAQEVDAMIIIGGLHSSNTKKLYEISKRLNPNSFWIESAEELDLSMIFEYNSVGVTAGASTPSWTIEEVTRRMENYSKDEFMEQVEDSMTKIYPREIVKGEVIYVTDDEVIVNINYKSDGIVELDELSTDPDLKPRDLYEEGQEIEVYVIKLDDGEGNVVLSTRRVEGLKNWNELVEAYENKDTISVNITKEVKGGLLGKAMGIIAFLPGSQVTTHFVKDLSQFVGQDLDCRIISLDEKKRRLVVSSRVIIEEETSAKVEEVWEGLEENEVVTGKVARLTDFGAFINFGGVVDGLIHISDLSWNRIDHPSSVLKVGDDVDVLVLKMNKEKNRISLGYKQLQPKPFEEFTKNNKEGDVVKGQVVNLVNFGAFVRLEEGVEGLIHISEISYQHVEQPSDELSIGQDVEVKILNIDDENKRIGLSIKALTEPEPREEGEEQVDRRPKRTPKPKRRRPQKQRPAQSFQTGELDTSIGALLNFDLSDGISSMMSDDEAEELVTEPEAVEEAAEEAVEATEAEELVEAEVDQEEAAEQEEQDQEDIETIREETEES